MVLGGRFRPEPQKFVTFGHFPHFSSHFMIKRGKAEKTRKCTFSLFGRKVTPAGGVKTIACSYVFHVFLTLAAFSSQNQLFSGNMHFFIFSWKWPEIRTFRWKGGPCRSTPPKTICFVSEFQCFARPEKVWKHRISVFHDFRGFSRKTGNFKK